jgi:hypothetical protein
MLEEMGDTTFRLGNVHTSTYELFGLYEGMTRFSVASGRGSKTSRHPSWFRNLS